MVVVRFALGSNSFLVTSQYRRSTVFFQPAQLIKQRTFTMWNSVLVVPLPVSVDRSEEDPPAGCFATQPPRVKDMVTRRTKTAIGICHYGEIDCYT
jgi:hypothetical protein